MMRKCPHTGLPCMKPQIFHVTNINGKEITEESCCEDCFPNVVSNKQIEAATQEPLEEGVEPLETPADVLKHLMGLLTGEKPTTKPIESKLLRECPGCKSTIRDISKTSKLGCPQCYETFKGSIESLLERTHKSTKHVGKRPKNIPEAEEKPAPKVPLGLQIETQEAALSEAIKVENYERAAALRDSINALKQRRADIAKLGAQLDELVKEEKYEEAAKVKKQIEDMR